MSPSMSSRRVPRKCPPGRQCRCSAAQREATGMDWGVLLPRCSDTFPSQEHILACRACWEIGQCWGTVALEKSAEWATGLRHPRVDLTAEMGSDQENEEP